MPLNIKDIDRGIGVLITSSDSLEDTEYFEALKKHLTQDEAKFKKYRYTVCDLTGLTKINVSNKTVEQVASLCEAAAAVNPRTK